MTFAAPLFLLAAPPPRFPIALHLMSRRRAKDLPFPTLRFLKRSAEKTRRRRRIHDVLLMALRAAALLLVAARTGPAHRHQLRRALGQCARRRWPSFSTIRPAWA